jgi:hypothetical protein
MIGLDYGFLGGWSPAASSSASPPMRNNPRPIYEPGSLVPLRGGDKETAEDQGVHLVYAFDRQPLGRGSYGEVHAATHLATGARRAIKSVGKASLRRYVSNVTGFVRREVDILRRLDHPNICRLYEAFEDDQTIYLVLELCDGGDLLERVAVARERLPEKEAAFLFLQMLGSVQHLYLRGVVHRDLKPENFLFSRREAEREPLPPEVAPIKLIDFGLSRRLSFEAGMRITPKIGTTEYMAPEAFQGRINAALADRTDMWSMGVVLHVMFIGHFPSPRLAEQTPEEYLSASCWSRVSSMGRDLLGQMLRYEPARRPTVTVAMKHPWLQAALNPGKLDMVAAMPNAVRSFAASPGLRRLALAAAAREMDDCDLQYIRALFQALELECDGALTRPVLERTAWMQGTAGATAAELTRAFDCIDTDGSGSIDWTELVAVALGAATEVEPSANGEYAAPEKRSGEREKDRPSRGMPPLHEHAVLHAFDLLSQGGGAVSGAALDRLFNPSEANGWLTQNGHNTSGEANGTSTEGGGDAGTGKEASAVNTAAPLDALVKEVEPSGSMDSDSFTKMAVSSSVS